MQGELSHLVLQLTGHNLTENAATGSGTSRSQEILARVRRHIAFPDNPAPTVATVIDAEKLRIKNPSFYASAQNGDYLILTATEAILYSVERDVVLAVAPIQIEQKAQQ